MEMIDAIARGYAKGQRHELTAYEGYRAGAVEQKAFDIWRIRQFFEKEVKRNGTTACIDDLFIERLCKTMEE